MEPEDAILDSDMADEMRSFLDRIATEGYVITKHDADTLVFYAKLLDPNP